MNARVGTGGPALHAGRRMTSVLTDALVGARFLSVWLATGVLLLVAKIIAPGKTANQGSVLIVVCAW